MAIEQRRSEMAIEQKEATIFSLSEDIRLLLYNFQDKLTNQFDRLGSIKDTQEVLASRDNVLDDIIDILKENKSLLSKQMSFISSEVLPKIS